MAFITDADYLDQIRDANLQAMTESDPTIRENAEATAIEMVEGYLFERYDTDAIFAQTGTDRNRVVLRCVKHITLYDLHKRLPKRLVPEHVLNDYRESVTLLERINGGEYSLKAPRRLKADETNETRFRGGSQSQRGAWP